MPQGFNSKIIFEMVPDGRTWILQHEVQYTTISGIVIYVPAGSITDGASTPRFLWRAAPPMTGKHRNAAFVHDWLYRKSRPKMSKEDADKIFLEIMEMDGVGKALRILMYKSVVLFGNNSYKT